MPEVISTELVFWEKPGCQGNRRQQAWLRQQGFNPEIRDLLGYPWTARELMSFFAGKPVSEWFNSSAPAIKSGAIDIHSIEEDFALLLMVNAPILIRRPLLQLGDLKQTGFVDGAVLKALGVDLDSALSLQSCVVPEDRSVCETAA